MQILPKFDAKESVDTVFILLGNSCNMSCRHCSQIPVKGLRVKAQRCEESVISWIREWSLSNVRGDKRIYFWGGEPLLYIDTITDIVERLSGCNLRYVTTSNGILLTDSLAEYFNDINLHFVMSYDAPNSTALRNAVPSEDNIKAFLKINSRAINAVLSALNDNVDLTISYLENKFPETRIDMGFMQIISTIPADSYTFNWDSVLLGMRGASQHIIEGKDPSGGRANFFRKKTHRTWCWNQDPKASLEHFMITPQPPCMSGVRTLSVDLNGSVYPCHNSSMTIGNIAEDTTEIWLRTNEVWKSKLPPNCVKCEHLDMCQNRCPFAQRTPDGKSFVQCEEYEKKYWEVNKQVIDEYNLCEVFK